MSAFAVASLSGAGALLATPVAALTVGGLITVIGWWFFFGVFGPAVVGALLGAAIGWMLFAMADSGLARR